MNANLYARPAAWPDWGRESAAAYITVVITVIIIVTIIIIIFITIIIITIEACGGTPEEAPVRNGRSAAGTSVGHKIQCNVLCYYDAV